MPVGMSGGTDQQIARKGNDRRSAVRLPRKDSPTSATGYSSPSQPRKQNTTPSPSVATIPRQSPSSTPCSQSARTTLRHYLSPRPSGVHGTVVGHRFLSDTPVPTGPDQRNTRWTSSGSLPLQEPRRDPGGVFPRRFRKDHPYTQDGRVSSVQEVDVHHHPFHTRGKETDLGGFRRGDHRVGQTGQRDGCERYVGSVVLLPFYRG